MDSDKKKTYVTNPSFWMDKRVIVTGGAGFLGNYVVNKLETRGAKEIIIPLVYDDSPQCLQLALLNE